MADSSREFLERAHSGDRAALDRLIEQHLPALRGYVRLRCGAQMRAQESTSDLVQSACREVLEDLSNFRYEGEAAFRCWLFKAAERKIVDRFRYYARARRDVRRNVAGDQDSSGTEAALRDTYATIASPSEEAMANELMDRLEAAFDELPESQRDVLLLSRLCGLSSEEIGREIGQSASNVRTLQARALTKLSALLDRPKA